MTCFSLIWFGWLLVFVELTLTVAASPSVLPLAEEHPENDQQGGDAENNWRQLEGRICHVLDDLAEEPGELGSPFQDSRERWDDEDGSGHEDRCYPEVEPQPFPQGPALAEPMFQAQDGEADDFRRPLPPTQIPEGRIDGGFG